MRTWFLSIRGYSAPSLRLEVAIHLLIAVVGHNASSRLERRIFLPCAILLALKPAGQGLTVVGDDAQSIYSFRASTVRNILDFPEQFTPVAEIITLDRNYRSTQPILAAANAVIELAAKRFT
jgi:superfamily I DNA/RNA helicase